MIKRVFSPTYKCYVLTTLSIIYMMNFLDQNLLILVLQSIKADLHLSDTQLGFLTGIAFGLLYATLQLPVARWADRGNRTTIASIAIGLWGTTVMLCLLVTNFWQLVLARVAAAIGGSGCMPPTYSLLGDYFPAPAERTRAMTIYMSASSLASLISFIAGGWLTQLYGWRIAFVVLGIPGVVAALLVKITIVEPRVHDSRSLVPKQQLPRVTEVLAAVWRQRSSRHLTIAIILFWIMASGLAPWYAAFMMRSHGMRTGELGVWLGLVFGLGGMAGTLLGGYVAARWFAADERGQMRLIAGMIVSLVPCFAVFLLVSQRLHALIALVPFILALNFSFGPIFALMQRLVPDHMRATAMAMVMLLANLIGMGVGPQMVGILSDLLGPRFGSDSLRYAMLATSLMALWAAYHFWQSGRTVRTDLLMVDSVGRQKEVEWVSS